jgi:zinc transport system substrate-binding protein
MNRCTVILTEKIKLIRGTFLKHFTGTLLLFLLIVTLYPACSRHERSPDSGKLKVVATIFPLYDFVRTVGGDAVDLHLLLPPGTEPHSFEPRPEDMMTVAKADIFIYTNSGMEPWAEKLLSGITRNGKPVKIEAGQGARYINAADSKGHAHKDGAKDPHIWLDIANAMQMIDTIANALAEGIPAKKELFRVNAAAYKARLKTVDDRFRAELANCDTREFIHGGHFAFAYLAERYNLNYISAYGVSADSEPSPKKMMELIDTIRRHKLKSVFYEELLSPAVARSVAAETGATLLKLHGIHNITRQELESNTSYTELMEQNLAALRKGLVCR